MSEANVPSIIWGQISISTKMACGARKAVGDKNTLTFQVTITPGQCHKVEVTLDPSDTYTVKLWHIRGAKVEVVEEHSDVYCDVLSEVIYRMCNK